MVWIILRYASWLDSTLPYRLSHADFGIWSFFYRYICTRRCFLAYVPLHYFQVSKFGSSLQGLRNSFPLIFVVVAAAIVVTIAVTSVVDAVAVTVGSRV